LPIVVEWIDRPERVEALVPAIRALVRHGLITVDDVDVLLFDPAPIRDVPATRTVADVMSKDVADVGPGTPVRDVVERTLGKTYRAVPVVEGGRPIGIVTSGDLVRRGGLAVRLDLLRSLDTPELHEVLERLSAERHTAADVMTAPAVTIRASAPLPSAAEVMARHRLKRLPVVDEAGALVGMVSRVDLLRTVAGGFATREPVPRELGLAGDRPLAAVMRRDVPAVHPESPIAEVFQAVVSTRLNRVLVVDGDRRVVGLVTDAELLARVTPPLRKGALRALVERLPFALGAGEPPGRGHAHGRTAADVMTRDVATVPEDALLSHATALMLEGDRKVLAVVDAAGRLTGIVDRADLLHGLLPLNESS
jgi:CBS domain-containing protein